MRDWGEAARYQVITPGERRLMTQLALQLGLPRDEAGLYLLVLYLMADCCLQTHLHHCTSYHGQAGLDRLLSVCYLVITPTRRGWVGSSRVRKAAAWRCA